MNRDNNAPSDLDSGLIFSMFRTKTPQRSYEEAVLAMRLKRAFASSPSLPQSLEDKIREAIRRETTACEDELKG